MKCKFAMGLSGDWVCSCSTLSSKAEMDFCCKILVLHRQNAVCIVASPTLKVESERACQLLVRVSVNRPDVDDALEARGCLLPVLVAESVGYLARQQALQAAGLILSGGAQSR